jgi:hypothetical protein
MSTYFDAWDMRRSFHPDILFAYFSSIGLKTHLFIRPSGIGSPRYLTSKSTLSTFRILLTSFIITGSAPSRTNTKHFIGLSCCHVPFSNKDRSSFICCAYSPSSLKNSKLSSAKSKCVMLGALLETRILVIKPCLSYLLINTERQSATRRNK